MSKPLLPVSCVPCRGDQKPLPEKEVVAWLQDVPEWRVSSDGKSISRAFTCKNYTDAIAFISTTALIAEEQDHHPDHRLFKYKNVEFTLTTHATGGLTLNDFVVASLIDQAWTGRP